MRWGEGKEERRLWEGEAAGSGISSHLLVALRDDRDGAELVRGDLGEDLGLGLDGHGGGAEGAGAVYTKGGEEREAAEGVRSAGEGVGVFLKEERNSAFSGHQRVPKEA
jgi:hypothetical protein